MNDTEKIFKKFGFTKKKLNKESLEDLDKVMQAITKAQGLKRETAGIAEVYANSIKNLLNKNEIKSELITENKEAKDEIKQQENAALTKIQNLINETSDKKLNAKERKTKFDKIKNKIKKAFFGSTKTKTEDQKDISELFQRFSNDDNALISKAINETLGKINNGKDLVDFFKNPIIRYILYHSKVFPTFEKSFMQNVNKIVELLPKVDLKEGQIRFGKTLGQAIRKQLYNNEKNKFQNWVLILGPASRVGSKNIKKIKSDTNAALKNMVKNLKKVNASQIDNMKEEKNLNNICNKFANEKNPMLYLKLGLLSNVKFPAMVTSIINSVRKIKGTNTKLKQNLSIVEISNFASILKLENNITKTIEKAALEKAALEEEALEEEEANEFIKNMGDLREYWNEVDEKVNGDKTIGEINKKIEEMEKDAKNGIKKETFEGKIKELRNMISNIKDKEIKQNYYKKSTQLLKKIEETYNEVSKELLSDVLNKISK